MLQIPMAPHMPLSDTEFLFYLSNLFRFSWDMIPKTGMGTKDFIAPTSFDFRQSRTFRVGTKWGVALYTQIMASELFDNLLAELLEVDAKMTISISILCLYLHWIEFINS